jgi:hypothetical protein
VEFQSNPTGVALPNGFVGGNKLPGNGTCMLLDVVLEGPYYIDPDWFNGAGGRLTTRWDGTRVPVESVAREWWRNSSQRSPQFASAGTVAVPSTYTRNNCNGTNDEGLVFNTYYLDSDNDQFGAGLGLVSCQAIPIPGYVLVNGDCDDMNPNVYPGATEILDNDMDENCDGVDGYLGLSDLTNVQVGLVPNPSNGVFAVQFNTEVANGMIQVTDMNGKVLFQQLMNGTNLEVSNLSLSSGAYLVHVTLENQKEILRLIIQ